MVEANPDTIREYAAVGEGAVVRRCCVEVVDPELVVPDPHQVAGVVTCFRLAVEYHHCALDHVARAVPQGPSASPAAAQRQPGEGNSERHPDNTPLPPERPGCS